MVNDVFTAAGTFHDVPHVAQTMTEHPSVVLQQLPVVVASCKFHGNGA